MNKTRFRVKREFEEFLETTGIDPVEISFFPAIIFTDDNNTKIIDIITAEDFDLLGYDDLNHVIQWFRSLPPDYNAVINLDYARTKLATMLIEIAGSLKEAKEGYNTAVALKEIKYNREKNRLLEEGFNTHKATAAAKVHVESYLMDERKYKTQWQADEILFRAMVQNLNSLASRINGLKGEERTVTHRQRI